MTVLQLYENFVLPLLGETSQQASCYETFVPGVVTAVTFDLWELNNGFLRAQGQKPRDFLPAALDSMDDLIPLNEALTCGVMPYGVAAFLVLEDDKQKTNYFDALYREKKLQAIRAAYVSLEE